LDILVSVPALSKPGLPQISKEFYHGITKARLFGGFPPVPGIFDPPNKKSVPLRPLRLCGECEQFYALLNKYPGLIAN
jgi:hypothetical protein